jgi:hypothetical protein
MEIPQKIKNRSSLPSSTTTDRDIPEGLWVSLQQRHLYTHVYYSTIRNRLAIKTAKMPHYWLMDKENVAFLHNEILLIHKEEWNFVICW